MKILYIATAAEFGGVSRHILWLAEYLISQGHQVGFVTAPEPRLLKQAQQLGVELFPNPYFVRPVQLHNDVRALWPVFQAIRKFNPDLVSAHSTKAGYAARLACAILRKPVIFTAHGWAFTEGRSMWKRRLLALAERLAAKVTAKIICVSEHDRQLALKFKVAPPEKLTVIHNGIDPRPFEGVGGFSVRKEFSLTDYPVLTMVGRLAPPKDFFTLLKAFKRVEDKAKLLIVGGGELYSEIQRFVREKGLNGRVILTGEREDIPEILTASDIFVLATNWEGLPRSIIEAMMVGLPVVATEVGGVPELVENEVTGFLIPPRDPDALAEVLQRLIADSELRRRMGQAGREKALKEFTLRRMIKETERVYIKVKKQE